MNHLFPPNPMRGPWDADGHLKKIKEQEEQIRRDTEKRQREMQERMNRSYNVNNPFDPFNKY